jgi:hypothetical protein
MTPPTLWFLLSKYWTLPDPIARSWWRTLTQARWSKSVEFKQTVLYFSVGGCGDRHAFLHQSVSPARTVEVLEALVEEQLLGRAQASRIEDTILKHVTHDGDWI